MANSLRELSTNSAAAALGLLFWCNTVSAATMHWVHENVDPQKTSGVMAAALDAAGFGHMVYGRSGLYYDWQDASGWHSEAVDVAVAPDAIAMVLDAAAYPCVVYIDRLTSQLKFARRSAGGWATETLAQDASPAPTSLGNDQAAIVLDAGGWPHVGYRAGPAASYKVKYVSKDSSGWHAATLASGEARGLSISISIDGLPHLAWKVGYAANALVYHSWREASGWRLVQTQVYSGGPIPLRFDDAGRLHVAHYSSSSGGQIRYLLGTGGTFVARTLASGIGGYYDCALAVSRSGVPHVAFGDTYGTPGLQHWSQVDGVWQQTMIDTNASDYPLLALDAGDRPHLLYRTELGTNWVTKQAWQDTTGWHVRQLEPSAPRWDRSEGSKLMVSNAGQLRYACAFYDVGTRFYSCVAGDWQARQLAPPQMNILSCNLALDSRGYPHVAYVLWPSGPLPIMVRYAGRDESGWHIADVDMGTYGDRTRCDLGMDNLDRPHLSYVSPDGTLRYATVTNAGWQSTVADSRAVWDFAFALDRNGSPHLLAHEYIEEGTNSPLVHLWREAGGWSRESVAQAAPITSAGDVAFPAIAVDSTNGLHICFHDFKLSKTLKHGQRSEQGWQIETVVPSPNGGLCCSLAVDHQNQPHIAYGGGDQANRQLNYARKTGTGWEISTVFSGGAEFYLRAASIDVTSDGKPQIAFTAGYPGSLRYARLGTSGWEVGEVGHSYLSCSLAKDAEGLPHIAYFDNEGRENLSYLHVPLLSLTELTPLPGDQVRLRWKGAVEGVGVDRCPTLGGPWTPIAENLSGLEGIVEGLPAMGFFRLRHSP